MEFTTIIKLEMFLITFLITLSILGVRYLKKDIDKKIENLSIEIKNVRKAEEKG